MRPDEIRDAVKRNVPVLMASGSIEYHGPHLPIATDYLIAEAIVARVEKRCECVVMPPLPFAPTMFWAGGCEDGEFDFKPEAIRIYIKEILLGLIKVGFRRIYILQHHQGAEGTPFLTLKQAASEVMWEVARDFKAAWGRDCTGDIPVPQIFSLMQVHPYIDNYSEYPPGSGEKIPIGHGGKGETQLIMAVYPETVKMEELRDMKEKPSWLLDADEASIEEGERWVEFCVEGWVKELSKKI